MLEIAVNITPYPQSLKIIDHTFYSVEQLSWSCKTQSGGDCSEQIAAQKDFYTAIFFPKGEPVANQSNSLKSVAIKLNTVETPKSPFDNNETYELISNKSGFFIDAYNTYALSRALATMSQIIQERDNETYTQGMYSVMLVQINDYPAYKIRSLLVDTSRHFLPFSTLKRQINALAIAKMDILHIHIIDTQSNSFAATTEPANNYQNAAYNNGQQYLLYQDQLKELAQYSDKLGIFLMIEYDMPDHTGSWKYADQDIVSNCPFYGNDTVNPLNEKTYQYIESFLTDIIGSAFLSVNRAPLIHLGGDEVTTDCWNRDPNISQYLDDNGLNARQLWQQFHQKVANLINNMNQNVTRFYWQESFDNGNDMSDSVINMWYSIWDANKIAQSGSKFMRSEGWYLDRQQPYKKHYLFQDTWQDFYAVDPMCKLDEQYREQALGGETCMWGEMVNDGNIDEFIWPRALAVAEVLWTAPASTEITQQLKNRMQQATCKLLSAGVGSGPIMPSAPCPGFDDPRGL